MNNKRVFPTIVSYFREEEYNRVARNLVREYKSYVYPILLRFRLLDDEHIRKYLRCTTAEEIYKDAIKESKDRILFFEQEAYLNGEDFWEIIRDKQSPVKNPSEKGFIFKKMPSHDYNKRELIISSLSVNNREIEINEAILQEGSYVVPTEKQKELYNLVSDFCDELKNRGFSKRLIGTLFYNEPNTGKISPNIGNILGLTVFYEKKK